MSKDENDGGGRGDAKTGKKEERSGKGKKSWSIAMFTSIISRLSTCTRLREEVWTRFRRSFSLPRYRWCLTTWNSPWTRFQFGTLVANVSPCYQMTSFMLFTHVGFKGRVSCTLNFSSVCIHLVVRKNSVTWIVGIQSTSNLRNKLASKRVDGFGHTFENTTAAFQKQQRCQGFGFKIAITPFSSG